MDRRNFFGLLGKWSMLPIATVPTVALAGTCFNIPEISGEAVEALGTLDFEKGLLDAEYVSIGQALQKWLLANCVPIDDVVFVLATNLAFENHIARGWPSGLTPIFRRGMIMDFAHKHPASVMPLIYDGEGWIQLNSWQGDVMLKQIVAELKA